MIHDTMIGDQLSNQLFSSKLYFDRLNGKELSLNELAKLSDEEQAELQAELQHNIEESNDYDDYLYKFPDYRPQPISAREPIDEPVFKRMHDEARTQFKYQPEKSLALERNFKEMIRTYRLHRNACLRAEGKQPIDPKDDGWDVDESSSKDQAVQTDTPGQRQLDIVKLEKPTLSPKAVTPPFIKSLNVSNVTISEPKTGSTTKEKCLTLGQLPNELNISIECIADCVSNEENSSSKKLEEERDLLLTENERLKSENQDLLVKVDNLDNSLRSLKRQNSDLAKNLQASKLKVRDKEKALIELNTEYYKQHDLRDQYHRAYLNLTSFADLIIKKLQEMDTSLNVICRNRFLDFDGADSEVKMSTLDHDNVNIVGTYLANIQLKIDNLLIDSVEE